MYRKVCTLTHIKDYPLAVWVSRREVADAVKWFSRYLWSVSCVSLCQTLGMLLQTGETNLRSQDTYKNIWDSWLSDRKRKAINIVGMLESDPVCSWKIRANLENGTALEEEATEDACWSHLPTPAQFSLPKCCFHPFLSKNEVTMESHFFLPWNPSSFLCSCLFLSAVPQHASPQGRVVPPSSETLIPGRQPFPLPGLSHPWFQGTLDTLCWFLQASFSLAISNRCGRCFLKSWVV